MNNMAHGGGFAAVLAIAITGWCMDSALACSTLVASKGATVDGSVMAAHSNDGDGNTAGSLSRVIAANWTLPQERHVSGGSIPQVSHTHAYFTKVGGYASTNEYQVGLAESTCVAVDLSAQGTESKAVLNIVDLSALGLERANTSRQAVAVMGHLAETYGYNDAGESLLVVDPNEAFIFHVMPDDTKQSAIWVAQRVPDGHVAVVANSFTVRAVDFNDAQQFMHSSNMRAVARRTARWKDGETFDFTRIFAGPEPGRKYHSGRRMWSAFNLLAPSAAAQLSPYYTEYVSSAPYPATLPAHNVSLDLMMRVMRDYYQNTSFDLSAGLAAGPFGTPDRWLSGGDEGKLDGSWERAISVSRTIVSYVVVARSWLPDVVGGVLWFSTHASHTSVYVPFPVGMATAKAASVPLPVGYTNASGGRGVGMWSASRFVYNAAQLRFNTMHKVISAAQNLWEGKGQSLLADTEAQFVKGLINMTTVATRFLAHADAAVAAWWELSDTLMMTNYHGYPLWWLSNPAVNYSGGPPESPPVPPPHQIERLYV